MNVLHARAFIESSIGLGAKLDAASRHAVFTMKNMRFKALFVGMAW